MDKNKIQIEMLKSYENTINIKLFNEIVSFIIETTNCDCKNFIEKLKSKTIWFEQIVNNNIQEEYGFKYFGELLERYEQRIGTHIKDIRAIALSLGYSKELINENMIIGTQLVDFINKIKRLSEEDIYLKAALYLYDENKYNNLFKEIVYQKFDKTEDVVFVLSLFYDIKQGFDILETQLKELLGKSKSISATENCGIYNWLINNLYPIIKNNRKKGIELYKALISIPTGLINKGSKTHNTLLENGYTLQEISFLNYICIFYSCVPKSVKIGKSLVEEKIAIEFCINILNSEFYYPEEVYNLIYKMFSEYYRFDIKCYGFIGLKEAIINYINITEPKVFMKFYEKLDKKFFSFDILDSKWEILKDSMTIEEYRNLFDEYLLLNDFDKAEIETRISKYDNLTSTSYLSTFNVYRYGRNSIFSKLVASDVINLKNVFNQYLMHINNKDNTERMNIDLEHLKEYVRNIENRKSFEFIKYFLSINNHAISDLHKYHISLRELYNNYRYSSSPKFDIKRSFLSNLEQKELFTWLESYIFYTTPDYYMDFVYHMLDNSYIETILSKEDLRKLYFVLMEFDKELKNNTRLREKYLTPEELEQIEQEEYVAKEEEKQLKRQALEKEVMNKFKELKNLDFKSIYEYCYFYRWQKEETAIVCKIVKDFLEKHITEHEFIKEEIKYFNKICNLLIEQNFVTVNEIRTYLLRYIKEGELIV